ncbi:hypothetical protein [Mycobacterium vicinigordonae]|uniref:Uncharacterized protein n=1 Tax=Mycobacterium vicinigordonae TaxID=1719132 RepID=A0A7D6DY90_9MYCO|nr:hypothetical protein [Mycobacterium vicinigordonae]QLL06669.1 hypothetical protein H0P51_23610 [Mycobacterium vicinigordonae]
MDAKRRRAEYKRRPTIAIKMMRDAGMSEEEIQAELLKLREALGISVNEPSDNLPAVIDKPVGNLSGEKAMESPAAHQPASDSQKASDSRPLNGRDWANSAVPQRRCKAHKKDGSQCSNPAIRGGTVCRFHGGAAKHVKRAARARLENAADRMAKELLGMAIDPDISSAVKLAGIRDALDRAGLKAPNEVVLSQGTAPYEEIFDSIVSERPDSDSSNVDSKQDSADWLVSGQSTESIAEQPNSTDYKPPPAPAEPDSGNPRDRADTGRTDRDSDRLSADESRVRRDRDRYHQRAHITGEDAYQAANAANREIGALRALPPGRTASW